MGKHLAYLFVPVLLVAAGVQWAFGNPDIRIFAFPVNVAVLLALTGGLYVLNRERRNSRWTAALASGYAGVAAILLAALCCLVIACFPACEWQRSWVFLAVLLLLLANLFLAVLRYRGRFRIRFYLNHAGLFLLIAALAFGAADMRRMRAAVNVGESIDRAYTEEGAVRSLGYTLVVEDFEAEFYDNRTPSDFRAVVSVGDDRRTIRVNHPWHKSWKEDVYLTGYDTEAGRDSAYCILEFVVQPWKYVALTGLLLFMAGAFALVWGGRNRD